ncbi:MAG: hypothetical protein WD795_18145 [Woeseia sp.]
MSDRLRSWFAAQTWREVSYVPFDDPPYLAAAAYLAVLAFPDDLTEGGKRDRLLRAISGYAKTLVRLSPGMRRRDILRAVNRGNRLVGNRLRAAGIAGRVMLERASGEGMRCESARSINEAILTEDEPITLYMPLAILSESVTDGVAITQRSARAGRPEAGLVSEINIYRDVWIPSKPVLHMAIALRSYVIATRPTFDDLLTQPAWSMKALAGLPALADGICQAGIATPANLIMLRATQN